MKRTFTILARKGSDLGNPNYYCAGFATAVSQFQVSPWTCSMSDAYRAAAKANENPVQLAQLQNLRFWEFMNGGWVRITLRPGQRLTWRKSSYDEEGYSHFSESWEHEGDRIVNQWGEDCSDCDGRLTRGGEMACSAESVAAIPAYGEPTLLRPDWKKITSGQRDYAAEAAGY